MIVTKKFTAKNTKELGICLRLMCADNIQASACAIKSNSGKVVFEIKANLDEDEVLMFEERYRTLIN